MSGYEMVGEGYLLGYSHCECRVWPVVVMQPLGRCGACGGRMQMAPATTEQVAIDAFNEYRRP